MTKDIRLSVLQAFLGKKTLEDLLDEVEDETLLFGGGLGISSLKFLQGFVKIEQQYGIVFDDQTIAENDFRTVGDVVGFVQARVDEAA